MDPSRLRQRAHINTRQRPLARKHPNLLAEVLHLLVSDLAVLRLGGNPHKVLQQFAAGLLLQHEGDLNGTVQEIRDKLDVRLEHVSRGDCGRAETNTTWHLCGGVTGHGILVDRDANNVAELLELAAGESQRAKIPENKVVIGTVGLQLVPVGNEFLTEGLRIGDDLLSICLPCGLSGLQESGGDTGNGVVVGATLACREDRIVDTLLKILSLVAVLAEENQTSTRTTKSLVSVYVFRLAKGNAVVENEDIRSSGDDITVLEGVGKLPGGDETTCVSDVRHEERSMFVGNGTESSIIPVTRVGRSTTDDQFGLEDLCL